MKFSDYIELSKETRIYRENFNCIYPTLKVVGEIGELSRAQLRADKIKELGDVSWYIAALASDFAVPNEDMDFIKMPEKSYGVPIINLMQEACKLSEAIGKAIRDNEPKDLSVSVIVINVEQRVYCIDRVKLMLGYCVEIAEQIGIEYSEVLKINLEKLRSRKERNKLHGSGDSR